MPLRFFQKALHQVTQSLEDMVNPKVGSQLLALTKPTYAVRFAGRSPELLIQHGGFAARRHPDKVKEVRREEIDNYQELNIEPFGIGACASLNDLVHGFAEGNSGVISERTLYGMFTRAAPMSLVRLDIMGEASSKDFEKEHLILHGVPLDSFLLASSPKYRKEFNAGLRVPNELALCAPELDLPKSFNRHDALDLASAFSWLLDHNSEKAAKKLCAYMFRDSSLEDIKRHFEGDRRLVSAARFLLKDVADIPSKSHTESHGAGYKP